MPQDSAILPGYTPIGIHSNHMDMPKFANADDPGFVALSGELRRWIKETEDERRRANLSMAEQPGVANQYGENNRQYNLFSEGTQKNTEGHYFEANGDQNFGIIPPIERKAT